MPKFFLVTIRHEDDSKDPLTPTLFNLNAIHALVQRGHKAFLHVRTPSGEHEVMECVEPFEVVFHRIYAESSQSKGFWDDLIDRVLPKRSP